MKPSNHNHNLQIDPAVFRERTELIIYILFNLIFRALIAGMNHLNLMLFTQAFSISQKETETQKKYSQLPINMLIDNPPHSQTFVALLVYDSSTFFLKKTLHT